MPTLYLCGPINGRSDDDCRNWREQVKELWAGDCLDPMRRDYRGREAESVNEIVAGDLEDIENSDAIIVYFDKPSVGTSMEMVYAKQAGKPIVLVDAGDKPLSPWLIWHSTHITKSVQGAVLWLGTNLA